MSDESCITTSTVVRHEVFFYLSYRRLKTRKHQVNTVLLCSKACNVIKKLFFIYENFFFRSLALWYRSSHRRCSVRKSVLRNFVKYSGKHLCQNPFFSKFFSKKQTLAQVFSCKFCRISKNTFLHNTAGQQLLKTFYAKLWPMLA